jgi:hypothetical protein
MTIEQAQEMRLSGNWIVTNRKLTKVLFCGSESEARKCYSENKAKRGGANIFGNLVKIEISKAEIFEALTSPSLYSL